MSLILTMPNHTMELSKSQMTFNRLIKKLEKLQQQMQDTEMELNHGLQHYHMHVHPMEQEMVKHLLQCIPMFYAYYQHPKSKLSKQQSEGLQHLIRFLLERLCSYVAPQELDSEIVNIIKDIEGFDVQEVIEYEFQLMKEKFCEFASEQGLELDLSDINSFHSKEELMDKIQQALSNAKKKNEENLDEKGPKEKIQTKTKQQLKKEKKAQELEEIRKKGFSKIYKELAKVLHPDLEVDPTLQAEKEALMKQLTTAYEKRDLHALLSIEVAWMNRVASNKEERHLQIEQEQLTLFNSILKDQVASLTKELNDLTDHPRYDAISRIIKKPYPCSISEALEHEKKKLAGEIFRYASAVEHLHEGSNFNRLKEILKEFSAGLIYKIFLERV